jgi:hypothetical protein
MKTRVYYKEEDGIEVHYTEMDNGKFSVAVKDTDANLFLDTVKIFPTQLQAIDLVKDIIGH